ncbi:MAG: sulfite exporter TauE/SafE family protein [Bradyrhizobiaceae bacterium]|nr:sulfite exporter TauE/SafE family protein [Bradyrhizobiaceae bacterium]
MLFVIALLLGITLGMLGAGGAIVAVPAFVYVGGVDPTDASGYALFVVMVATFVATIPALRRKAVHWPAFLTFGSTTFLTVFGIRYWIMPALPEEFMMMSWKVDVDVLLMLVFGIVLLTAGALMLRHKPSLHGQAPTHPLKLAATGVGVGTIAGFLGVGGGFLITPALVVWGRIEMKVAVATSIALICVNSAAGVVGDLTRGAAYDWPLVLTFTGITTAGIIIGGWLHQRVHADGLRKLFGYVVIAIGVTVLAIELYDGLLG